MNKKVKNDGKNEVKILANGKIMKVQKTRQRKILSCVYCHSKKIKCSRVHPTCNNCEKLGLTCKYFINDRVSKGGRNRRSNSSSEDIDEKVQFDDGQFHRSISPIIEDYSGSGGSSNSDNEPEPNELKKKDFPEFPKQILTPITTTTNNNLDDMKPDQFSFGLSSFTFANYSANQANQVVQMQSKPQPQDQVSNDQQSGYSLTPYSQQFSSLNSYLSSSSQPVAYTRNDGQAPREDSSTNISFLFAKNPANMYPSNNLQSFLDQQSKQFDKKDETEATTNQNYDLVMDNAYDLQMNQSNSYNDKQSTESSATFELNQNSTHTKNFLNGTNTNYDNHHLLEDLENHLPNSGKRSYELIERYIKSVHILLPIVTNIDDFVVQHDKYWKDCNPYDKESNDHLTDFNFLQFYTLYFPILYASTISEFEEYDNLLLNQDIDKYLKAFNKICQYYNYPHGLKTIPLLLGNVLIQSTSPNPSTMEMSQVIRYAKFLQMNKDPVISLKIKNPEIIKFRRLLWWTIFGLDCLTSHNFCLAPVCRFEDFNVLLPSDEEPIHNKQNEIIGYKLNTSILSSNIKFKYDRILNELVQQLHNDSFKDMSVEKMNEIKKMILDYFEYIHISINKMNIYHKKNPPKSVNENNLVNFIKNHSWSFVDRAIMLLHKKFLLNEHKGFKFKVDKNTKDVVPEKNRTNQRATKKDKPKNTEMDLNDLDLDLDENKRRHSSSYDINLTKPSNGILSFNEFENTFQNLPETNLIKNVVNFQKLNINLKFSELYSFSYNDINNNLIPSILHNLNDFLKYNDFLKFGKYNWYVKRTIPLDSIILLIIIIIVKFKYEMITFNELIIYVKLINKSLFILNRKWFKNEKYKRMLSLTNLTWEFILKKFKILHLLHKYSQDSNFQINLSSKSKLTNRYEYFNYQLTGYINTTELFKTMKVAQPLISSDLINRINEQKVKYLTSTTPSLSPTPTPGNESNQRQNVSEFPSLPMSILTPIPISSPNTELVDFIVPTTPSALSKLHPNLIDHKISFDLIDSNYNFNLDDSQNFDSDMHLNETNDFELENNFTITKKLCNEFKIDSNELTLLKQKILFDLRNNYVDINDYCAFYISLENIISEVIRFIEM